MLFQMSKRKILHRFEKSMVLTILASIVVTPHRKTTIFLILGTYDKDKNLPRYISDLE